MKELRWTVHQKGNLYIVKSFRTKTMAKLYRQMLKIKYPLTKFSISRQKVHIS